MRSIPVRSQFIENINFEKQGRPQRKLNAECPGSQNTATRLSRRAIDPAVSLLYLKCILRQ